MKFTEKEIEVLKEMTSFMAEYLRRDKGDVETIKILKQLNFKFSLIPKSEMKKAINVKTQEQRDKVMEVLGNKGWKVNNGRNPTEVNYFNNYKEDSHLSYNDDITFGNGSVFKEQWYTILSFEEFLKEEGEEI